VVARSLAASLSSQIVDGIPPSYPMMGANSSTSLWTGINSLRHWLSALYSDSAVDKQMQSMSFDFHSRGKPPSLITKPILDLADTDSEGGS
jgi:hypothetical protein